MADQLNMTKGPGKVEPMMFLVDATPPVPTGDKEKESKPDESLIENILVQLEVTKCGNEGLLVTVTNVDILVNRVSNAMRLKFAGLLTSALSHHKVDSLQSIISFSELSENRLRGVRNDVKRFQLNRATKSTAPD